MIDEIVARVSMPWDVKLTAAFGVSGRGRCSMVSLADGVDKSISLRWARSFRVFWFVASTPV